MGGFKIDTVFKTPFASSGMQISDVVFWVLNTAMAIAGIGLLILIIGAGISIIASAGSGNTEGLEKGKKTVTSAMMGFLIVIFAYFIVRLMEVLIFQGKTPFTG